MKARDVVAGPRTVGLRPSCFSTTEDHGGAQRLGDGEHSWMGEGEDRKRWRIVGPRPPTGGTQVGAGEGSSAPAWATQPPGPASVASAWCLIVGSRARCPNHPNNHLRLTDRSRAAGTPPLNRGR